MSLLSCKKFTELSSLSLETPLSLRQRFLYRFHFCLCFTCRRFKRQISIIEKVLKLAAEKAVETPVESKQPASRLSEEAKSRIKAKLSV